MFRVEGEAGEVLTLRLWFLLRLPGETRAPEAEGRSPVTVRAFRPAELPEIRAPGLAGDAS